MKRSLICVARRVLLLAILGGVVTVLPAMAEVAIVSGKPAVATQAPLTEVLPAGAPADVAVSLANGFPLWYGDSTQFGGVPLKLQLCTDSVLPVPGAPGVIVNPCEYEPPLFGAPPSFPSNFGAEAIYWSAVALGSYTSTTGPLNNALLVLALEATGANGAALVDGAQAAFSRIRLRIDLPVAGTYRITHPYGSSIYEVTTPGLRAINQTQDLGIIDLLGPPVVPVAQNFLVAMNDVPAPVPPVPFDPAIDAAIVNTTGATVGPFLVPATILNGPFTPTANDPATFAGGPIVINGLPTYLGLPFAPPAAATPTIPASVFQPVTGSPAGTNFFRIELLTPPANFVLNTANNSQVVQFDNFLLIGKLFNDGPNLEPTAVPDVAATAANRPVNIDVTANDIDLITAGNIHGINPQAIALADVNGPLLNAKGMPLLTATRPTTAGGTVRRVSNIATGKANFLYTPPADVNGVPFFGTDTFQYVVQDSGGLISAPATVSVLVENLQIARADFRTRTGKWHIRGTSSDSTDNTVTLFAGPRARLTPEENLAQPVTSAARGNATLRVTDRTIEITLKLDPLPATPITAVHIQVGAPGRNDSVIFTLYNSAAGIPFANPTNLTLDTINLQRRPDVGVSTIEDAVNAILSGNANINVHTTAFPAGELRGQFIKPRIGSAVVGADGWELRSPSTVNPGALPSIIIESSNGVRMLDTPLRRR